MSFHETAIFPTNVSRGSRGAPRFRHNVLQMDSGEESAIARWPTARRKYNARYGIKRFSQLQAVHDFWLAREGISHGFRLYDLFDHSTASDHRSAPTALDVDIGNGDGSTRLFQMYKTYTSDGYTVTRVIEKPINGTVLVSVAGFTLTEGTHYTIDYSIGQILFDSLYPPGAGQHVRWGGEYHVPCHFGAEMDDQFEISIDAFEAGAIPDIPIVEMLGNVTTPDQPWRGRGTAQTISAASLYDYAWGHTVRLTPTANNLIVVLPYIADLATGMPVFCFINAHATYAIQFYDRATQTLQFTIPATKGALVGIYSSGGSNQWIGLQIG